MADLKKMAEDIVGLTLLEAQELKTILKDEYGIEPAAGGAVMMAGPAGDAGGAAAEEKSEFDVVLKSAGGNLDTGHAHSVKDWTATWQRGVPSEFEEDLQASSTVLPSGDPNFFERQTGAWCGMHARVCP